MGNMLNQEQRMIEAGTNYDINKSIIRQVEKELKGKAFYNRIERCIKPFFEKTIAENKYYMLLCHDKRYYTILHCLNKWEDSVEKLTQECYEILKEDLGHVYLIEPNNGGGIEIWLEWADGDIVVMYLFECDPCVVEV